MAGGQRELLPHAPPEVFLPERRVGLDDGMELVGSCMWGAHLDHSSTLMTLCGFQVSVTFAARTAIWCRAGTAPSTRVRCVIVVAVLCACAGAYSRAVAIRNNSSVYVNARIARKSSAPCAPSSTTHFATSASSAIRATKRLVSRLRAVLSRQPGSERVAHANVNVKLSTMRRSSLSRGRGSTETHTFEGQHGPDTSVDQL